MSRSARYFTADAVPNTSAARKLQLVEALTRKSIGLEYLFLSFLIDAERFFDACEPACTWQYLKQLTLTSSLLTITAHLVDIFQLLIDAGEAALSMPRLETMVLWNGGRGQACAFMYNSSTKTTKNAALVWRGTWALQLRPDVIESWQKIAWGGLSVKYERVTGVVDSHGDAIYNLQLPDGVVDPRLLWQIRREGRVRSVP